MYASKSKNWFNGIQSRKRLFADRVSANKKLFADTVSANKKLFADSGVPIEKNTLREEVYYMVVFYFRCVTLAGVYINCRQMSNH